jgi:hypothetical protein
LNPPFLTSQFHPAITFISLIRFYIIIQMHCSYYNIQHNQTHIIWLICVHSSIVFPHYSLNLMDVSCCHKRNCFWMSEHIFSLY